MLSVIVKIQNEFGEWTETTVHAHSVPDLYHEIAERCTEFDTTTCGNIVNVHIGVIVCDDSEDCYN